MTSMVTSGVLTGHLHGHQYARDLVVSVVSSWERLETCRGPRQTQCPGVGAANTAGLRGLALLESDQRGRVPAAELVRSGT